jgi:hypothetical protein
MNNDMKAIGLLILMFVIIFAVKYLVRFGANKADDAISNSIRRKKSEDHPAESENLADRFKK